ncbi:MAG: HlyD family efflux transporter periplasmic adaptor subunit [Phenylobacterium sp.]|uniref:HlyD family secretion protein n=1 Tax=Phenylobacterium sp. TaxID=1871053 RepID=UPI001A1F1D8C|nr:HlyD family efflux transporter periplasmic adaptor subunit [Phenylobacterium sp.]MBJ7409710.1 HlyD family efflux transporter periplasmic adaptor subunit [Phenylobacterium sp.]
MNRQRLLVAGLIGAAAVIAGLVMWVPRMDRPPTLSGYIEGEPLYMAAPVAGTVRQVSVVRGQDVAAGEALFVVDPAQVRAQADQASAEAAAAQAQAQDARKGQRPAELAVFEANIAAAEARARDAHADLRRVQPLVRQGWYAPARLDDARAAAEAADAQVRAARKQRDAALLGAREDQVRAADARVTQAQAAVTGAAARLAEVAPRAPARARVEDVFFHPGEWAPANQPILSLLPDERIKVRFFVPERDRAAYRIGRTVRFACDGCASGLSARIEFVAPRPEFTPPVIYSREARDRLVYLVEARPSARLNPGQPVDVEPLS